MSNLNEKLNEELGGKVIKMSENFNEIKAQWEETKKFNQEELNFEFKLLIDYIKWKLEQNNKLEGTIYFNIPNDAIESHAFINENNEFKKIDYLQNLFPNNIPYTATGVKELFDLVATQNPEIHFKLNTINDNSANYAITKLTQQQIEENNKHKELQKPQNIETEKFDKIIQEIEQLFNSQEFKNAKNKDDRLKIIIDFGLKYPELKFKFKNNGEFIEYFIRKQNYEVGDLVLCLDNEQNLMIDTPQKINSIHDYTQGDKNTTYVLLKNKNTDTEIGIEMDKLISKYGIIKLNN